MRTMLSESKFKKIHYEKDIDEISDTKNLIDTSKPSIYKEDYKQIESVT